MIVLYVSPSNIASGALKLPVLAVSVAKVGEHTGFKVFSLKTGIFGYVSGALAIAGFAKKKARTAKTNRCFRFNSTIPHR